MLFVLYSKNVVFAFEKGSNVQNHSSSGSHQLKEIINWAWYDTVGHAQSASKR